MGRKIVIAMLLSFVIGAILGVCKFKFGWNEDQYLGAIAAATILIIFITKDIR